MNVENNTPSVTIDVEVESNSEEHIKGDIVSREEVEKIQVEASKKANEKFNELVQKWQKDQSDILGIGARVRAFFPKYWMKKSNQWKSG
ncbi:hypothetical protein UACE39S_02944 [Ureibacillus acetophenoni]